MEQYNEKLRNITSNQTNMPEFTKKKLAPTLDYDDLIKSYARKVGFDLDTDQTDVPQQTENTDVPQQTEGNPFEYSEEMLQYAQRYVDSQNINNEDTDYMKEYNEMYLSPNKDYEKEYEEYTQQSEKTRPYGDLSQKWLDAGGAVKYDKYGKPVLDIKKTLENSLSGETPTPQELFSFLLPVEKGEESEFDVKGARTFSEAVTKQTGKKYNIKAVIDTSNLTPEERRELNNNKDMLLEAGIMGQNLAEKELSGEYKKPEKNQGFLKMIGRGVTSAINGIYDLLQAVGKHDSMGQEMGIAGAPTQELETKHETTGLLTKKYDELLGTKEPTTVTDKILQSIGEWLAPAGGINKGSKILNSLTKAVSAGTLTSVVKQLAEWKNLTPEEKAYQIKENAPMRDFLIDVAGGVMGLQGAEKIINKLGKNAKFSGKELEEIQKMQDSFVKGTYQNKIIDETRDNLKNNIKQELYKVRGVFDNETGIAHLSGGEIEKARKIFNSAVKQRDYQKIDELITEDIKIPVEKEKYPFLTKDRGATSEVNKLFESKETRELKGEITDDLLTKAKEKIKTKIQKAGEQYEQKIAEARNLKIEPEKIIENNDKISSSLIKEDEEKIINFYNKKIKESKKVEDLIKIQREINDDIYSTTEDGSRYILNNIQNNIKQYYETEAKVNPEFSKILEANKDYSVFKTEIDKDREVLDKLYGGKDRFRKAENRELTESNLAYENYARLKPEQQRRLQELAELEEDNVFQKISKSKLDSKKFEEYSDLELQNAFGKNAEKAINLSKKLNSPLSAKEASKQILDAYRAGKIDGENFKKFFYSTGNEKLKNFADNIVEEQNLFKQADFYNDLKKGNLKKVVSKIKTTEDVNTLEEIGNNLTKSFGEKHPDIKTIKNYIENIKENKIEEIFDNFTEITKTFDNSSKLKENQIEKIINFVQNNEELLGKLKNNNNITKNFEELKMYLKETQAEFNNIESTVSEKINNDKYYQEFLKQKTKGEKEISPNILTTATILLSSMLGGAPGAMTGMLTNMLTKNIISKIKKHKLTKLMEDPEYFAKKIKYNKKQTKLITNFYNKMIDEAILVGYESSKDLSVDTKNKKMVQ